MPESEKIVELSIEGCGARICKTASETGNPKFLIEVQSSFKDRTQKDDWKSFPEDTFETLHEALEELSDSDGWVLFAPISVSPDYRSQVLELIQLAGKDGGYPALHRCKRQWERFLSGEE